MRERREKVIACLRTLTDNLRQKGALPEKQSSDITKKIDCLNQQWLGGGGGGAGQDGDPALDDDVQDKLCKMVEAIEEEKWEQALKIQVIIPEINWISSIARDHDTWLFSDMAQKNVMI